MRFVTYNLRYDSRPDNITVQQSLAALPDPLVGPGYHRLHGEQPWSLRRLRVAEHLISEGIVLAGFQEALVRQVRDLAELLGEDWDWVGVGRDDGVEAGEYSPIFYKKCVRLPLFHSFTHERTSDPSSLSSHTTRSGHRKNPLRSPFPPSPTPQPTLPLGSRHLRPSRFPGAGSHRVCTTLRLQRQDGNKQEFTVLNTHLDDRSDAQRRLAASMVLARARYEAVTTGCPVFVLGDFNSPPTGRDSSAYEIATGIRSPEGLPLDFAEKYRVPPSADSDPPFVLHDLRSGTHIARRAVSANYATFTGFTAPNDTREWKRIDFAFGAGPGWEATGYKVGTALTDDGVLATVAGTCATAVAGLGCLKGRLGGRMDGRAFEFEMRKSRATRGEAGVMLERGADQGADRGRKGEASLGKGKGSVPGRELEQSHATPYGGQGWDGEGERDPCMRASSGGARRSGVDKIFWGGLAPVTTGAGL
ncbi:Endo/exonuclease/phosphatase domain-containing protein [Mycena sanguinolenta]|uniref:Endo/exonuclease/phosphatase domain-containing protein n=1 Tax=Mycena sanguinolenta TaxID=230812 RepID=A0A8H7CXB9_9AGAR|nr:Endo/exonuclease/phosphatase domain-containing protein [Mycena sanguinolenta]